MKNLSLTFLKVIFWLTLIGVATNIAMIAWVYFSHFGDWEAKRKFYESIDFTRIFNRDITSFSVILLLQAVIKIVKFAAVIYVLKILRSVKLDSPFLLPISHYLKILSVLALIIGMAGAFQVFYIEKYVDNALLLSTSFSDENYLVLSAFLYLLHLIFMKGFSLQTENDLTI